MCCILIQSSEWEGTLHSTALDGGVHVQPLPSPTPKTGSDKWSQLSCHCPRHVISELRKWSMRWPWGRRWRCKWKKGDRLPSSWLHWEGLLITKDMPIFWSFPLWVLYRAHPKSTSQNHVATLGELFFRQGDYLWKASGFSPHIGNSSLPNSRNQHWKQHCRLDSHTEA